MSIEDTYEVEYRLSNGTIKRSLKVKVKTYEVRSQTIQSFNF